MHAVSVQIAATRDMIRLLNVTARMSVINRVTSINSRLSLKAACMNPANRLSHPLRRWFSANYYEGNLLTKAKQPGRTG